MHQLCTVFLHWLAIGKQSRPCIHIALTSFPPFPLSAPVPSRDDTNSELCLLNIVFLFKSLELLFIPFLPFYTKDQSFWGVGELRLEIRLKSSLDPDVIDWFVVGDESLPRQGSPPNSPTLDGLITSNSDTDPLIFIYIFSFSLYFPIPHLSFGPCGLLLGDFEVNLPPASLCCTSGGGVSVCGGAGRVVVGHSVVIICHYNGGGSRFLWGFNYTHV